jgi:hypothetical protein
MNIPRLKLACALAGLLAIAPVSGLRAQGVNPDGYVLSSGWLALGPFWHEYDCSYLDNDFLVPFLLPTLIQYETPAEGEEIEYDPARSANVLFPYLGPPGPLGKPVWRQFEFKDVSGDLDFLYDQVTGGGPARGGMSFAATYFDYLGDTEANVKLCASSDDGIQVWIDSELVHNFNVCRDDRRCADLVPVTIRPGNHRLILAVWNSSQEHSGSIGFRQIDGTPISDTDREWRFRGKNRPSGFTLPNRGMIERKIASSREAQACPNLDGTGPLLVTLQADVLSDGSNLPILRELLRGSFGPEKVILQPDSPVIPEVTARAGRPLGPWGDFAGSEVIVTHPDCAGKNGSVKFDQGSTPSDDLYTLENVGFQVWASGDNCTFAYNRVQGDFEFTARIKDRKWVKGSRWGQIGLMARQDLTPRSRYTMLGDYGEEPDPNDFEGRPTHGGRDNFATVLLDAATHHDWLKLRRSGDLFEGFSSPDGSPGSYVRLGETCWMNPPDEALVGLFVSSGTGNCDNGPATGVFDRVQLTGTRVPPGDPAPIGVEIVWRDVPREALRTGLSYSLALDPRDGLVTFDGFAVDKTGLNFPVLGAGEGTPLGPVREFGPFSDPDFPHAHVIGVDPSGDSASNPAPGKLVISGGGKDNPYTFYVDPGDRYFFAYRRIDGDFSARVTVAGREVSPRLEGDFGIMARQDCGLKSRFSFMRDVSGGPLKGTSFVGRRTHQGRFATWIELLLKNQNPLPFPGQHADTLRLDRCGDEFIGYALSEPDPLNPGKGTFGADAGRWVELGRQVWESAPPSVFLGLAVTSFRDCDLATITFDRWRLYPSCGEPPPARFVRGDVDSDGAVDLTDAVRILDHLFLGGPAPECLDAADTDDDAELSLTDPIVVLSWLFLGGAPPAPPGPSAGDYPGADCGTDPTPGDGLDCFRPGGKCR